MADPLSVIAASLQIAELFAKIVVRTRRLANQLKDAPEEIRRKGQSLDDFHSFCASYQHVLTQNSSQIDIYVRREDVNCIKDLLSRAEVTVDSLETILSILQPQSTDGRLETWLKAAKTIHRGKDITAHVHELCELRAQVDSFFVRHSWSLLAAQSTKTETGFAELQASQSRTDAGFSDVRRHQNNDHKILDGIKTTATEINVSQQSISQGVEEVKTNIKAGFASLHDSSQVLESVVRTTGSDIEAQINRGFEGVHSSLAAMSLSDDSIRRLALQIAEQRLAQPALNTVSYTASPSSFCPCQRLGRVARLVTIGPITIVSRQFGAHQPGCQYHSQSNAAKIERELSVELSKRHGRYMTASLIRFATTASSFLNGALWFAYIVDDLDDNAPGFIHMSKAKFEIRKARRSFTSYSRLSAVSPEGLHQCRQVLKQLHSRLLEDFNVSRNWSRIQRSSGETLLHALMDILMDLWTVQDEVSDIVTQIIRLLIDGGTSVNATKRGPRYGIFSKDAGEKSGTGYWYDTALSYCTSSLSEIDITSKNRTVFLQLFSQHSIPAFSSHATLFNPWMAVRLFVAIPDLAIGEQWTAASFSERVANNCLEYGCSRLCLAVITRDRSQVEHLLQSGAKVNDTSQAFSALSFAIEWPAGVEILLAAGADPSQAIQYAIVHQNTQPLKLLLEANGLFFEPEKAPDARADREGLWSCPKFVHSLIDLALCRRRLQPKYDNRVFAVLIKAFALARNELMKVAKTNLSISQLKDLNWTNASDPHHLIDSAAGQTFAKLKEMGVECRKNLWPGRAKTIYHSAWMDADVAEMLFKAGFTEIDRFDQDGITPLLLNTHYSGARTWWEIPRVLLWFLNRGAKNMVFPTLNNNTFVHKLAANLGAAWLNGSSNKSISEKVTKWLPMILKKCAKLLPAQPKDLCQCFCSREGCSQIQSLIKHMSHKRWWSSHVPKTYTCWDTKQNLFELWNDSCPEALAGPPSFTALCRIELFERLGMRHTCCKFVRSNTYDISKSYGILSYVGHNFHLPEPSEAVEFRAEDAFSNLKLEGLMLLYEEFAIEYSGDFEEFWKTWWIVMEDFAPPEVFSGRGSELGTRLYPEYLPIPVETLEQTLQDIRRHVARSIAENRTNNAVFA